MRILYSQSLVPADNASLEESLFRGHLAEPTLFLYRNQPSLCVGRHQLPWREINLAAYAASPIPLIRRISGGGTVFLDPGCLAFAFLVPQENLQRALWVQHAVDAIRALGIPAQLKERHSVFVGERKVVGTAFAIRTGVALVHGSILVATDLSELRTRLAPNAGIFFDTDAVPSVPAPVANLQDFSSLATIPALVQAFANQFNTTIENISPPPALSESPFRSTEWNWFSTPDFTATLPGGDIIVFSQHRFTTTNPFPKPT